MKFKGFAATAVLLLHAVAGASWAQDNTVIIDIAGYPVPVVAGGLYDRYRSNPPLSVVAAERPNVDLSWFQSIQKTKVNVGFETWTPNFYYVNNSITAIFTADLKKLKELIPAKVLAKVTPLQIAPGRGVVALTAYRYDYCDNDEYNEISLSVVTNKPGSPNFGPISLLTQQGSKKLWGYVLKLPVNTELARVRGVVGYNLPKWLTPINYRDNSGSVAFEIFDSKTGQTDVVFEGKKLANLSNSVDLVTNSFTNLDKNGQLTYGYSVARQLSHASSMSSDSVKLTLSNGEFSTYIKALKLASTPLIYEYVPQFQLMLHAPQPLSALN